MDFTIWQLSVDEKVVVKLFQKFRVQHNKML